MKQGGPASTARKGLAGYIQSPATMVNAGRMSKAATGCGMLVRMTTCDGGQMCLALKPFISSGLYISIPRQASTHLFYQHSSTHLHLIPYFILPRKPQYGIVNLIE